MDDFHASLRLGARSGVPRVANLRCVLPGPGATVPGAGGHPGL